MQYKEYKRSINSDAAKIVRFAKDCDGNTSIIFAIAMIPMAMVASMAVDYGNSVRIKNELQAAADAGALAAATAMATGEDDTSKTGIAEDTFFANLSDNTLSGFSANPVTDVNFPDKKVTMNVAVSNTRMINTLLADHMTINVTATAVVDEGNPICLMALNPNASDALWVNGTADIVADGCSIHVNSSDESAMRQNGSGTATADSFCVNGDYSGSNYSPTPETGCRVEKDPLEDVFGTPWAAVDTSTCDFQSADVFSGGGGGGGNGNGNGGNGNGNGNGGNGNGNGNGGGGGSGSVVLLQPGVYCGELNIGAGDTAILQHGGDGLYVFKDGGIDIQGGGTLRNYTLNSDGVTPLAGETWPSETTIVLAGDNPGVLEVNGGGNVEIKANSTGPFSGFAVAQPSTAVPSDPHLINGGGTVTIDGVVYLPAAELSIRGNGTIGDNSSQFAIMADTLDIRGNGQLEIRISSDYQSAGLPQLPEASERVRLAE